MRTAAVIVVVCATGFGCLGACSGGTRGTDAGENDAAGGTDGGVAGMTCQDIRVCAGFAASDADLQKCIAMAPVAAQNAFGDLQTCLTSPPVSCASDLDVSCFCPDECYADGRCVDQAKTCLGGAATDLFCGGPCAP